MIERLGDGALLRPVSLLMKQRMLSWTNLLLELSLYLLPLFFLFKDSYATSIYIWIFGFFIISISIQRRLPKFASPVSVPVILLLVAVTVPSMMTIGPANTWREAKHFLYGIGLFFVLLDQLSQREIVLKRYLLLLVCVSVFLSLDTLWQYQHGSDIVGMELFAGRGTAVFSNPNYLGFFMAGIFPVHVYFVETRKKIADKIFFSLLLVISLLTIGMSGCRSPWGGIVFIYFIRLMYASGKENRVLYGVLPVSFLIVLYFTGWDIISARFMEFSTSLSGQRSVIWRHAVAMIREHFFLGAGLDSFKHIFPGLMEAGKEELLYSGPHFFPFEVWQSSGVIAFGVFLYFLYRIIAANLEYIKDNKIHTFLFLSLGMVVITSIISIPLFSRYVSLYFWLFLGLLFGAMKLDHSLHSHHGV